MMKKEIQKNIKKIRKKVQIVKLNYNNKKTKNEK